jgi:hypothetical protein
MGIGRHVVDHDIGVVADAQAAQRGLQLQPHAARSHVLHLVDRHHSAPSSASDNLPKCGVRQE